MVKKKLIFGCSALARRLFYSFKIEREPISAFVADDNYCDKGHFCGIPLVQYSKMEESFPAAEYEAYIAIGYSDMNAGRKKVMERLSALGYSLPNYIHPSAICTAVIMGVGNLIFAGSVLDMDVQIGDGNILFPGVMISHDTKIGSYNFFAPRATLAGDITIGKQNFFGLNCSVKNGVEIGDRCLIGASAYTTHDLKDGSVLAAPKSTLLERNSIDIIKSVVKK